MPDQQDHVDRFVSSVRRRLNRELGWRALRWSLLGGGGVMLAIAAAYVLRGHEVPAVWYVAVAAGSLLVAAGLWWTLRWTDRQAELFVDRYFDLSDSVSSLRGFERAGRRGGFYALQSDQVQQMLADLDPNGIELTASRALTGGALTAVVLAAATLLIGPSDAVMASRLEAEHIREQTAELNRQLDEYVQKLIDQSDDQVVELIDASELRRWVEELQAMDDRREALRQYAAFEREINRMTARLSQQRDEDLLAEAARELKKDRQSRELGEQLERKQYREAGEELESLSPQDLEDLGRERERLDRLQAITERMARAAREAQRQRRSSQSGGEQRSGSEQSGSSGQAAAASAARGSATGSAGGAGSAEDGAADEAADGDLAELIDELLEALENYDNALGECESGGGEQAYQLAQRCGDEAGDRLARIRRRLDQLSAARQARQQLAALCQALGECQASLAGMTQTAAAGGEQAGWGSVDSFDNQQQGRDDGQLTRLRGLRGEGPALTTIEDADSGTGTGTRGQTAMDVRFQRQVESFVQREDVPHALREGVKHYFENIHDGVANP